MNTLFELKTDEELRRDAVAANERRIHEVLTGGGPWQLTERQRKVLECLRGRQGRRFAMPISDLVEKLKTDPRTVKADVRELVVTFHLPIVASRDADDGGYFFAVTAEERISGTADYLKEAVKLIRRAAIIRTETDMQTLLGQVALDLRENEERISR
jgi:hypothetical protein